MLGVGSRRCLLFVPQGGLNHYCDHESELRRGLEWLAWRGRCSKCCLWRWSGLGLELRWGLGVGVLVWRERLLWRRDCGRS